ncbi:hypothetical protein FB45DRAFT_282800 [Roridomyces roridus]|uniref:Ice-binding protein n=1 Tax=Roridomyces roridus TaxID=1738132 RepID=A0AAD7FXN6_9AGAR|nr:hypothetical protein FB45DRAFT_282800 [Roridomyces roridus]
MHTSCLSTGVVFLAILGSSLAAGPVPIAMGSVGSFAVLAGTHVTGSSDSLVVGDLGVGHAVNKSVAGFTLAQDASQQFWTSPQVQGRVMGTTDAPPTPALIAAGLQDLNSALNDAMSRLNPDFSNLQDGRIGGSNLTPGLYLWTTGVTISSDITISGGPTDTFIFVLTGSFNQAVDVKMTLVGGALPQNIFWVFAGTATVGSGATFQGNLLSKSNLAVDMAALINGGVYALKTISLEHATVNGIAKAPPTTTTSAPVAPPTATVTPPCAPSSTTCFTTAFQNLNASIQAGDFMTFTLADTVDECVDFCACIDGCAFANFYFDNDKNTTQLTCAAYASCHTAAEATNFGGQSLPNGGFSAVSVSAGYCLTSCV